MEVLFMRRTLSVFLFALFILCGSTAHAKGEMIYPQPVQITVEGTGDYQLSFEGNLAVSERWAWFVCPDQDSAEDLMELMRAAIADGTPARGLTFDNVFKIWPIHRTTGIPIVKVPAGSEYVFYGKAYCGAPALDPEKDLFMITLGGTNLSRIKPGEIGGNDLAGDGIIPPKTGDSTNLFLIVALLAVSFFGLVLLIKRRG